MGVSTYCPDFKYADQACANGPVSFEIVSYGSAAFPPAPYIPPYQIQPCDRVTWDFGDGTTQTIAGSPRVTRDFPTPGNYLVRATVTNALGSATATMTISRVIATSPSRLSFVTNDTASCFNCVLARENDGSITIVVDRTLDLSRTISAVAGVYGSSSVPGIANAAVPLTFSPGETRKTFTLPIVNDDKFYGPRSYQLYFSDEKGGTFTFKNVSWQPSLLLLDDDRQPVLSITTPVISIREGHGGWTPVSLRAELSAPMFLDASANVFTRDLTALSDDFTGGYAGTIIPAGSTSGTFDGASIRGDTKVEPDEQFLVQMTPRYTVNDPLFGVTDTIVTILNDDAAFVPEHLSVASGSIATLTLDLGSPYATPTTITFSSSNEAAIAKPQPMTIPAGISKIDLTIAGGNAGNAILRASAPDRTTQPATVLVTMPPKRRSTRH